MDAATATAPRPPGLDAALAAFEAIAPLGAAGGWDNVGLLLEGTRPVRRIGVCIDLTEAVLAELEAADVDLVYAYHPLIFKGLRRITGATGIERVVLRLVRAGRHLFCPHTSLDAAVGGMGDWLAAAVGPVTGLAPIEPLATDPRVGTGRRAQLARPLPLNTLLPGILDHLGLEHVRVAGDRQRPISTVAVCPGSGGSVFAKLDHADLLITGELGHHEVLAWVARGATVVLTDHTNCERGFLGPLVPRISAALPDVTVVRSTVDADPLAVVSR